MSWTKQEWIASLRAAVERTGVTVGFSDEQLWELGLAPIRSGTDEGSPAEYFEDAVARVREMCA